MSGWRIGGASVRGAAHVRSGRANQDALLWTPAGGLGGRVVGAVSDGHGAALHFRSDVGAALAAGAATELLSWHLDEGADEGELAGEILRLWRARVDDHRIAHPHPATEIGSPYTPYGATLVAFGATREQLILLQIGDGDLLIGFADGRIERPLRADEDLVGEQTYSLCLDDAERRFRLASLWRSHGQALPDFAFLATDGISKSFRDDAAFMAAVTELRRLAFADWARTLGALPAWLDDLSEHGSGDDSTACLAIRPAPDGPDPEGER
jgi:serine/threonine protein phosphatase PrpC